MMILYLDTSALVKRYFREPFSDEILSRWQWATQIVTSSLAYAETMAFIYRKKREADLADTLIRELVDSFNRDWKSFIRVEISEELNGYIKRAVEEYSLRSFDAIHLASAMVIHEKLPENVVFACFDDRLARAARSEGLETFPPADETEPEQENRAVAQLDRKRVIERTAQLEPANRDLESQIDDRKRAEKALIKSEEKYRLLVENSNDLIYTINLEGCFIYVNPVSERLVGCPSSDVVGKNYLSFVRPDFHEKIAAFYRKQYNEKIPNTYFEFPIIAEDGTTKWIGQNVQSLLSDEKVIGFQAVAREITDRKKAEEALLESEKKYREWADFLPIPLFEMDDQGNVISGNPAIFETFGYTRDDLGKRLNVFHMTSTEDRDRIRANIQKVLSGEKKGGTEYTGIRKDGSIFPEIMFSSPILHENKPVGLRGAIIDLTTQKQTEASLQKISLSLAEAQRIAHIGNWEWDIKSDEMYCSDEIYRIFGATHQTFDGTYESFSELIYADDRETVSKVVQKAIDEGAESEFEHRIVRFDGSIREIRQRVEPILDDTGRAVRVIGIVQDVTEKNQADRELKNARDQLLQSEKLASTGRLSAGIAHEILNPVSIISMELQILQKTETLSPEIRKELGICMDQIRRIVTISENLKQFSRIPAKKGMMVMADINNVIGHVLALYSTQLKIEGVETELQYQSDLPEITIEREKIEQVIANLISNAMSFMEGRDNKVLRITTKREVLMGDNGQLRIVVADTGTGIKSEHMSETFDPFFTTKEQGKGTGLGLSISYGIIQDHGGKIWAENNEWGGASFYIELPEKPNISRIPEKNR